MTRPDQIRSELRTLKRRIYRLQDHRARLIEAHLFQSAEMTDEQLDRDYDRLWSLSMELDALGERGWWASVGAAVRQLKQTLNIFYHESPHSRSSKLPR